MSDIATLSSWYRKERPDIGETLNEDEDGMEVFVIEDGSICIFSFDRTDDGYWCSAWISCYETSFILKIADAIRSNTGE